MALRVLGIVLLLILAASTPALTIASPGNPAGSEASKLGVAQTELTGKLTHVYNMLEYSLEGTGVSPIRDALLAQGVNTLIIGGREAYAIIELNPNTREAVLASMGSLIGDNKLVFTDSERTPHWYGFAQSSGEILLVNASDYSYTLSYYTASRKAPLSALISGSETSRLVATDEEGFTYVFRVGEPYWLEIGPFPHDGALAVLAPFVTLESAPAVNVGTDNLRESGELAFIRLESFGYTGNLTVAAYYYNESAGAYEPALAGAFGNETRIAGFIVEDYNGLAIYTMQFDGTSTNLYPLTSLPPGTYTIHFLYIVINETNGTRTSTLYHASSTVVIRGFTNSSITLYANPEFSNVYKLEDAAALYGITIPQQLVYALVLNLTLLNETSIYNLTSREGAVWFTFLPVTEDLADIRWTSVLKPSSKPSTWPAGAEYLILAATDKFLLLYLADSNLVPVKLANGAFFEKIYLASQPVQKALRLSPDGNELYVGTEGGMVVRLVWNSTTGTYIGANVYAADVTPVTSISYDSGRNLLLVSTASGLLQLLDTQEWIPLWRGIPGYPGIRTGMTNLVAIAGSLDYAVAAPIDGSAVDIIYNPTIPLHTVMINITITMKSLDGNISDINIPEGTVAVIYNGTSPVAMAEPSEEGVADLEFYLPAGFQRLHLAMPGIGNLTKTYLVPSGGLSDTIHVGLREVKLYAYTPESIGDPLKDPGYYLVHGPKEGVASTLALYTYDLALGYTPEPPTVRAVTGADGTVVVTLWEGVSYRVTSVLEGYTVETVQTPLYGTITVELVAHPVLYQTTFYVVDNDTVLYGQPFYLGNATLRINLQETGLSVNVTLQSPGDYYYLPAGTYMFEARAPHYYPALRTVTISGEATITIGLDPVSYTAQLSVFQSDPTGLGIANGPLGGAQVNITMIWPVEGMVSQTIYTAGDGVAVVSLRYGVYSVSITHPYTQSDSFILVLSSDASVTRTLETRIAILSLYFKDAQFTLYGVKNVTLTLSYHGSTWIGNYTLNTGDQSIVNIEVPYGYYTIIASAKYYVDYVESFEIARNSLLKYVYMEPAMATVRVQVVYSPASGNLTQGPLAGVLVSLKLVDPPIPTGNISAVTDSDGIATFYVRQGVYDIQVSSKYIIPLTDTGVEVVGDTLISEPVRPGLATLAITLLDAESSRLVPGASLTVKRLGPGIETSIILENVQPTLNLTLPAGQYEIVVRYPGRYAEAAQAFDVARDETVEATFALIPLKGSLTFQINTARANLTVDTSQIPLPSTPIAGAIVTLEPVDELLRQVFNETITVVTDGQGIASIPGVRAGAYRVTVQAEGHAPITFNISVAAETASAYNLSLQPYITRVLFAVVDPGLADRNVTGYTLTILTYNGRSIGEALTLPGPVAILAPTGTYEILITKDRYHPAQMTLNITGDEAASVEVTLIPITVNIIFNINARSTIGIGGPVQAGQLLLEPTDWNLAITPITSNITGGMATATLRIGTYTITLVDPVTGSHISVGTVEVRQDSTSFNLTVEPQLITVRINLLDRDLAAEIYAPAFVWLTYQGPYGSGVIEAQTENSTVTVSLVPGNYSISVTSPIYEPYTSIAVFHESTQHTIILTPVRVTATFNLVDIDNNPVAVPNITVTFTHAQTGEVIPGMLVEGKIIPARGLRLGDYTLTIIPPEDAPINLTSAYITVSETGATPTTITAKPRIFTLTIVLFDPVANRPAGQPFTVMVERTGNPATEYGLPVTTEVANGTLRLRLPYGVYTIVVKAGEGSYFKEPEPVTVLLSADKNVTITLEPVLFKGTVVVLDDRNLPVQGALVVVQGPQGIVASGVTDAAGTFTFQAVYGAYSVSVEANGFKPASTMIYLPTQSQATVSLMPTPATVLKRYSILIVGIIGLAILGGVLYFARGKIMKRLAEEEEYF